MTSDEDQKFEIYFLIQPAYAYAYFLEALSSKRKKERKSICPDKIYKLN